MEVYTKIDVSISYECTSKAEYLLHELMALMVQSDKEEVHLDKNDCTTPIEEDEETGEVFVKEVKLEDITLDYLNDSISSVVKYGFKSNFFFKVIERNAKLFLIKKTSGINTALLNVH